MWGHIIHNFDRKKQSQSPQTLSGRCWSEKDYSEGKQRKKIKGKQKQLVLSLLLGEEEEQSDVNNHALLIKEMGSTART